MGFWGTRRGSGVVEIERWDEWINVLLPRARLLVRVGFEGLPFCCAMLFCGGCEVCLCVVGERLLWP